MKLRTIYTRHRPNDKWLIHEDGIKDDGSLYGMMEYNLLYERRVKQKGLEGLFLRKHCVVNYLISSDVIRNLNIEEYLTLSTILKMCNAKYNKKKDKFIISNENQSAL